MLEAVVFDFDGTLINIPVDYDRLYRRIEEHAKIRGVKGLAKALKTASRDKREKAFEIWTDEELQALPHVTLNEKGMQIYRTYSNKPLALVTMQGRETVNRVLRELKLRFQFVVTREDSLDRAEQLTIAIKKLRTDPRRVLVVGDRDSDEAATKSVGCDFLRV